MANIRLRLPTVVIIGRPNVGKSSLFNRIYGKKRALVHDMPGVTRDRLIETVEWHRDRKHYRFACVDTGGIGGETFAKEIERQVAIALEGADLIFWVVDVKAGLTQADEILYRELKKGGLLEASTPLVILANKVDDTSKFSENDLAEFYRFSENIIPVSAEHNGGIEDVRDCIVEYLLKAHPDFGTPEATEEEPYGDEGEYESDEDAEDEDSEDEDEDSEEEESDDLDEEDEDFESDEDLEEEDLEDEESESEEEEEEEEEAKEPEWVLRKPRIAIVGKPNVGKSTLVNALLRQDRMIVSPIAGTTIDSIDSEAVIDNYPVTLIDTAGIRRKDKTEQGVEVLSVVQTKKALERCQIAFLVLDGENGIADQDEKIGGMIEEVGCSVVLIMNKWDTQKRNKEFTTEAAAKRIRAKIPFLKYAPVVFLSAKERTGFRHLGDLVADILKQRHKKLHSHEFTEWVRARSEVHNPWNVRFYFCHQTSRHPPTFTCHVSKPEKIDTALERHLMNAIREEWGFMGSPIRMRFTEAASKKYRPKPTTKYQRKTSRRTKKTIQKRRSPSK